MSNGKVWIEGNWPYVAGAVAAIGAIVLGVIKGLKSEPTDDNSLF